MAVVQVSPDTWSRVDDALSLGDGKRYILQASVLMRIAEGSAPPATPEDSLVISGGGGGRSFEKINYEKLGGVNLYAGTLEVPGRLVAVEGIAL